MEIATFDKSEPGVLRAKLTRGPLDSYRTAELSSAVLTQTDAGIRALVIDLRECTWLDSAGMGILIRLSETLQIQIVNASNQLQRVVRHLGFADWLTEDSPG